MPRKSIPRSPEQDAARKAQKQLQWQRWYVRNAEKKRAQNRAWKAANAERQRTTKAQYRDEHQAEIRASRRDYYLAHKEEELASARVYRHDPEHQPSIRAYNRAYQPIYSITHAEQKRVQAASPHGKAIRRMLQHRRKARKAAASVNDFTAEQWRALCKAAGYRCCYCGKKFPSTKLQPDHLTPYAKQGSNTLHNILPCCGRCNSAKRDRDVPSPVQPFLLLEI